MDSRHRSAFRSPRPRIGPRRPGTSCKKAAPRSSALIVGACVVLALVPVTTRAAETEGDSPKRENEWFGLPFAFSAPETSVGFGAMGGVHLVQPGLKTSSIQPSFVYTLKQQSYAEITARLYDSERTAITGAIVASRFPDEFFGIGPLATSNERDDFTTQYAEVVVAREWEVVKGLRLGPKLDARAEDLVRMTPSGSLAASGAAPSATYRTVGLGATLTLDDRDNQFWPTRGTFVEAWALAYAVDRARAFTHGLVEARRFFPIGGRQTIGVDVRAEAAAGDVPFTLLPKIGGPIGLRGYYAGRWRDRFLWCTQAEWRFPIVWRLSGTAFGGIAGVAPSPVHIGDSRPRPAGGAGVRFRLTATGLNVRGDVGVGEDGPLAYITVGEAF